jgi:hypothetical protein
MISVHMVHVYNTPNIGVNLFEQNRVLCNDITIHSVYLRNPANLAKFPSYY